jgi:VWFA-related protein
MNAPRSLTAGLVAFAAAFAALPARHAQVAAGSGQATPLPTIFIDASVTDGSGRPVTTLRPEELRVSVDGQMRKVVSLRYVCRGPGADVAAALVARTTNGAAAAERARLLLLLADENAIARGQQKTVAAVVARMLDELGTADRAAVASLPRPPAELAFGTVAADWQAALARVTGRAVSDAPAFAQALSRPDPGSVDPSTGAQGVTPDDVARLELDRQTTRDRLGIQDNAAEGPIDTSPGASLGALRDIVSGLAGLPGIKSVVVFRHADSVPDALAPDVAGNLLSAVVESATRARVAVHVVTVAQPRRKRISQDDEMHAIAAATGGAIATPRDASDTKALDAIRVVLEGGYLIEVEGHDGDANGRPHAVKVESARRDTTVRAPRQWLPRNDPMPAEVVATPAGAAAATAESRTSRRTNDDAQIAILVARLSEYLAAYVRDFGNVVAEEEYRQEVYAANGLHDRRRTRSDLLLVKSNADTGWTQYRDVFEVDGQPVRDREERVQKLFLQNPAIASRLAEQISNESARYNLGTLTRTINTPLLPLAYLMPNRIGGLTFRRGGEDTVEGVRAARLAFEEKARPTFVRPMTGTGDAPASGTLWVDPASGRILMTRITVTAGTNAMTTTVVYKPSARLGLWLPAQMDERSTKAGEQLEGHAVYTNFRAFKVTTDVTIVK